MGVKVLGILAMVDDGETVWKVIVIDVNDPLADKMSNMDDVDREMPGFKEATREWFRIYKMPDGKPENVFGFDGAFKDPEFATKGSSVMVMMSLKPRKQGMLMLMTLR